MSLACLRPGAITGAFMDALSAEAVDVYLEQQSIGLTPSWDRKR